MYSLISLDSKCKEGASGAMNNKMNIGTECEWGPHHSSAQNIFNLHGAQYSKVKDTVSNARIEIDRFGRGSRNQLGLGQYFNSLNRIPHSEQEVQGSRAYYGSTNQEIRESAKVQALGLSDQVQANHSTCSNLLFIKTPIRSSNSRHHTSSEFSSKEELLVGTMAHGNKNELVFNSFDIFVQRLFNMLQSKLINHKGYFVKSRTQANSEEAASEDEASSQGNREPESLDFNLMGIGMIDWNLESSESFMEMVLKDKVKSACFQSYILQCEMIHPRLVRLADINKQRLIDDRYGNYILLKMCERSEYLLESTILYARDHFSELAVQEFGSKLIQVLMRMRPDMREFVLQKICEGWKHLTRKTPAIFMVTSCLRISPNYERRFKMIGRSLYQQASQILMPKYQKRVLVSYLEYCEENELEDFYNLLDFENKLLELFDDKYMVYIFRILLKRGNQSSERILLRWTKGARIWTFMKCKYSKFLLAKIMVESRLESLAERVSNELLDTLREEYLQIGSQPKTIKKIRQSQSRSNYRYGNNEISSSKNLDYLKQQRGIEKMNTQFKTEDIWFLLIMVSSSYLEPNCPKTRFKKNQSSPFGPLSINKNVTKTTSVNYNNNINLNSDFSRNSVSMQQTNFNRNPCNKNGNSITNNERISNMMELVDLCRAITRLETTERV